MDSQIQEQLPTSIQDGQQKGRLPVVAGGEFWRSDGNIPGDFGEDISWLIVYTLSKLEGNQSFVIQWR